MSDDVDEVIAEVSRETLREAYERGREAGRREGWERRETQNPRYGQPALYARCPGCGDSGDVAHIAACCATRVGALRDVNGGHYNRGWRAGVEWFALAATKMRLRRGVIIIAKLERAARRIVPIQGDDW